MIDRERLVSDKALLQQHLQTTEQQLIAHRIEVDRLNKQMIYLAAQIDMIDTYLEMNDTNQNV